MSEENTEKKSNDAGEEKKRREPKELLDLNRGIRKSRANLKKESSL